MVVNGKDYYVPRSIRFNSVFLECEQIKYGTKLKAFVSGSFRRITNNSICLFTFSIYR